MIIWTLLAIPALGMKAPGMKARRRLPGATISCSAAPVWEEGPYSPIISCPLNRDRLERGLNAWRRESVASTTSSALSDGHGLMHGVTERKKMLDFWGDQRKELETDFDLDEFERHFIIIVHEIQNRLYEYEKNGADKKAALEALVRFQMDINDMMAELAETVQKLEQITEATTESIKTEKRKSVGKACKHFLRCLTINPITLVVNGLQGGYYLYRARNAARNADARTPWDREGNAGMTVADIIGNAQFKAIAFVKFTKGQAQGLLKWRIVLQQYIEQFKATDIPEIFTAAMEKFKDNFVSRLSKEYNWTWVQGKRTIDEVQFQYQVVMRSSMKAIEGQQAAILKQQSETEKHGSNFGNKM